MSNIALGAGSRNEQTDKHLCSYIILMINMTFVYINNINYLIYLFK